ncbi:MAG: pyridoxamine 5'-phosphate oxidase family protein [Anaerolineae bacterium]
MNEKMLDQAVTLATGVGFAILATTDDLSLPHITAVGALTHPEEDVIVVKEWFCPRTIENLERHSSKVSIVAWNPDTDVGFQLLGKMEALTEEHVMNGYAADEDLPLPQVQRRLVVRIEEILAFSQAPHRDEPADLEA